MNGNNPKKKLLLVEDEVILAKTLKMALEKCGYSVLIEHTGEKAVETIQGTPGIDLILMDVDLGKGIDGTEAAALILQDHDIPVVFCSSHTEPDIVEKTEKITSYGYVVKSSSNTVLDASIKMAFKLFEAKRSEKKKEEELFNTKLMLEQTFEQSPVPMVLVSMPDGMIRIINPATQRFLGLEDEPSRIDTPLAEVKASWQDLDLQGKPAKLEELPLARSLMGIKTEGAERRIIRKDGSVRYELVSGAPIYGEEGKIIAGYLTMMDITERKLAELALQEKNEEYETLNEELRSSVEELRQGDEFLRKSEERYRSLLANLEAAIVVYAPDTTIVMNNKRASEILGLSENQMRGKAAIDPVWKFVSENKRPLPLSEYPVNRIAASRKPMKAQILGIDQPGKSTPVWITVNGFPVLDDKGDITEIVISFIDITERVENEQKLKLMQSSMEAATDALYWIRSDGSIANVNQASCALLGYTREEFLRLRVLDIDADYYEEVWKLHFSELREKRSLKFDSLHRAKDGRLIPVEIVANYLQFGNEEYNCAFVRDITERKRIEEALRLSELDLRQAQSTARIGSWKWNINTGDVGWSAEMYRIFGIDKNSYSGKLGDAITKVIHPDDLHIVLPSNAAAIVDRPFEYRIILQDGSIRTLWAKSGETVFDDAGKPLFMTGVAQDITERKLVEEKTEALLAEKELILKEVNHRIKNNMMMMEGLLQLQADKLTEPSAIAALQDAGQRMQTMRLLYEKLYHSIDFTELPLADYLSPLIDERVANFPGGKHVKVEKNIADLILDAKRLQCLGIIVNELLTNIMKYAFTEKRDGMIMVSATLVEGRITISVQDNGKGIPESINFENSTGFGLMLVNGLAGQLNGKLRMEREGGTRIVLEFEA